MIRITISNSLIDAEYKELLSAYAAPLGFIEGGAGTFAGAIPTILKVNSANSLARAKEAPSQAVTASVKDALRLGCAAIGFTIYPGSDAAYTMMEEIAEMGREAKAHGLAVVMWSYPRGGAISKNGETAMDICAYAAHMAALLGAHIIKVKPSRPSSSSSTRPRKSTSSRRSTSRPRPSGSRMSCSPASTAGASSCSRAARRRMLDGVYSEARAVRDGGANGSIIGRNTFQRPREDALKRLEHIIRIYRGEA